MLSNEIPPQLLLLLWSNNWQSRLDSVRCCVCETLLKLRNVPYDFCNSWLSVPKARDFVYTGFFVLFIYKQFLMHIVNYSLQILL